MSIPTDRRLVELARTLHLERPLVFLDLETTGTNVERDRIVELAVVGVTPLLAVERLRSFVNPGLPIPREATAIHGISDADVARAPSFAQLAPALWSRLDGSDIGGFNVGGFDLRMISHEFRRIGVTFNPAERRVLDAMTLFHQREKRDLTAAVRLYCGRDHDGHRAEEDVDATIDVFAAQLERYRDLPRNVASLSEALRRRKPTWLTDDGKVEWKDGAACLAFGRHAGRPLRVLARDEPDYLRWLLSKDFSDDLKKLAWDALEGRFPAAPRATG